MSKVITARDIEELIQKGGSVSSLPSDAIITPSARDLIRDLENKAASTGSPVVSAAAPAPLAPPSKTLNSKSPKAELEAFFNSPYAHSLKVQICEMGKRLWAREYV